MYLVTCISDLETMMSKVLIVFALISLIDGNPVGLADTAQTAIASRSVDYSCVGRLEMVTENDDIHM